MVIKFITKFNITFILLNISYLCIENTNGKQRDEKNKVVQVNFHLTKIPRASPIGVTSSKSYVKRRGWGDLSFEVLHVLNSMPPKPKVTLAHFCENWILFESQ